MKSLAIMLTLALTACHFSRGTVRSVELVEYGTFRKTQLQGDASASNTITGQMHGVAEAVLVQRTADIRAELGTSFGVRIKLAGEPDGLVVPCTAKCFHPRYTDPATGRSSDAEEWTNYVPIGRAAYIGYTFDNDWEIASGRWTIQVFVGSRLKVEQNFTVMPANAPNQALERSADRRENLQMATSTLKSAAKLAPASGG